MNLSSGEILKRLGAGATIDAVCRAAGLARGDFDQWWRQETAARVPPDTGTRKLKVRSTVRLERDAWGIPHIHAANDDDLFFGFGHAMAQDRLFQLDFLRRRGAGRLSEIVGANGVELDFLARTVGFRSVFELDLLARTVGLRRRAEAQWATLPVESRKLVEAFSAGINAWIEESRTRLPIEFDLLDYQPEPWTPVDCLTIEVEFAWYLTGRFPVIVIPELAKRGLGDGPLYRAFLESELDEESILPPGSYPRSRRGSEPIGPAAGVPEATGSNNWVVDGRRTPTGKPLLASDPHIAFEAVSCWYEVRLCGGSFDVAGMAYVGMPAVMFGRTARVAWGCTNNICSQRDLYLEKTDPAHPNAFLFDGVWEPERRREEVIQVKGGAPVTKTIRFSRNGPIVNEVLPPAARGGEPVALKWLGNHEGGWLTSLLAMDRANSAAEFREATRPWHVPTFSLVFADVDGHIGYQSIGRIPIRKVWERGYRPGGDPEHQWDGLIPFEGMPHWLDPERGWIATANNRPAPDDFPYPLSGCWNDGLRFGRIRQLLENKPRVARNDFIAMQHDALSMRAARGVPHLLKVLAGSSDPSLRQAAGHLERWDYHMEPDRVGATIFEIFFSHWLKTVIRTRFEGDTASLLSGGGNGLAAALLVGDPAGWFAHGERDKKMLEALATALSFLTERLGPDLAQWHWGKLHTLPLRHVLSGRGDLAHLLDHGGVPVKGNSHTVCNTGMGSQYEARSGPGYRLIADLSTSPPLLWAIDGQSASGHPGSPHYRDQLDDWVHERYHELTLAKTPTGEKRSVQLLEPL